MARARQAPFPGEGPPERREVVLHDPEGVDWATDFYGLACRPVPGYEFRVLQSTTRGTNYIRVSGPDNSNSFFTVSLHNRSQSEFTAFEGFGKVTSDAQVMTDVDVPSQIRGPNYRTRLHWLVTDIRGSSEPGSRCQGIEIQRYAIESRTRRLRKFFFMVFEHRHRLYPRLLAVQSNESRRLRFNPMFFMRDMNLDDPVIYTAVFEKPPIDGR